MADYFWYAERDTHNETLYYTNRASGVVTGYSCAEEAFNAVLQAARKDLGNNTNFTVIRFNKVGDSTWILNKRFWQRALQLRE